MTVRSRKASNPSSYIQRLWHTLPQGRSLGGEEWLRRHRGIFLLLWLHVAGLRY